MSKQKEIRTTIHDLEIRAKDDGSKTVSGYAVKFNMRSQLLYGEFYEKVGKGAFSRSLEENTIKALWNHDTNVVLGSTKNQTLRLEEDDTGLRFEIDLPNSSWGSDVLESVQRGDTDGVSFGFRVRNDNWEMLQDENVYERTLLDIDLYEISPTPFPAYPDSEIGKRSIDGLPDTKEDREQRKHNEAVKRKLLVELELI